MSLPWVLKALFSDYSQGVARRQKQTTKYVLSFMVMGKFCPKHLQILCATQALGIMTHKGELVEEKFTKSFAKKFRDNIPHYDIIASFRFEKAFKIIEFNH